MQDPNIVAAINRAFPEHREDGSVERSFIDSAVAWFVEFLQRRHDAANISKPIVFVKMWEDGGGPETDPLIEHIGKEYAQSRWLLDIASFVGSELVVVTPNCEKGAVFSGAISDLTSLIDNASLLGIDGRALVIFEPSLHSFIAISSNDEISAESLKARVSIERSLKAERLNRAVIDQDVRATHREHILHSCHMSKLHIWEDVKLGKMRSDAERGIQHILLVSFSPYRRLWNARITPEFSVAGGRCDICICVAEGRGELVEFLIELKVIRPDCPPKKAEEDVKSGIVQAHEYANADMFEESAMAYAFTGRESLDLDTALSAFAKERNVLLTVLPVRNKTPSKLSKS